MHRTSRQHQATLTQTRKQRWWNNTQENARKALTKSPWTCKAQRRMKSSSSAPGPGVHHCIAPREARAWNLRSYTDPILSTHLH